MRSLWNDTDRVRDREKRPQPKAGPPAERRGEGIRIVRKRPDPEAIALHQKKMRKEWTRIIVTLVIASVFAFLFLMPILLTFTNSFMSPSEINANYGHPVRISSIANKIGINRSYLSIIFKKRLGGSPQQYLIDFRLEKAAELIQETGMAVRAVAAVVGYTDPLTFSKAFKQKYGCSPSLFREKSPELMKTDLKGKYAGIHNL